MTDRQTDSMQYNMTSVCVSVVSDEYLLVPSVPGLETTLTKEEQLVCVHLLICRVCITKMSSIQQLFSSLLECAQLNS